MRGPIFTRWGRRCLLFLLGRSHLVRPTSLQGFLLQSLTSPHYLFSGFSNEILQAIVSRRPRLVHDIRPDIPVVLSNIIDKLLSKNPSDRYLTASGLVHDLQLCQLRLLDGRGQQEVSSSSDLLPEFLLGTMDRFSSFIFPSTVYGRQKELDAVRLVLQRVSTTQLQQYQPRLTTAAHSTGSYSSTTDTTPAVVPMSSSFGQQTQVFDQVSEAGSSSHPSNAGSFSNDALPALLEESKTASSSRSFRTASFASSTGNPTRGFTRKGGRERGAATRTVIVSGSTGMGKSALVAECQSDFRKAGWFGSARFEGESPLHDLALARFRLKTDASSNPFVL